MSEYKKAVLAPFNDAARRESIKKCNESQNHYQGKTFDQRRAEAIAKASNDGKCWWVEQYLRNAYDER